MNTKRLTLFFGVFLFSSLAIVALRSGKVPGTVVAVKAEGEALDVANGSNYWVIRPGESREVRRTSDGGFVVAGGGPLDAVIAKFDGTGAVSWHKTFASNRNDTAHALDITDDGGFILAGKSSPYAQSVTDIWVAKLNSVGNVEWQNTYGGSDDEIANSVQQTADGGYIVAGYTDSFGTGESDVWVLKLASDGAIEWARAYGRGTRDQATSIRPTEDGGYIVGGLTSVPPYTSDALILKLDSSGDIEWQKTYSDTGYYYVRLESVHQTSDGGFVAAGTGSGDGFDGLEALVLKLDAAGEVEWQKRMSDGIWGFWGNSIQESNGDGYILAGYDRYGAGERGWVAKISGTGGIEWQKVHTEGGRFYSIQQASDGGYVAVGLSTMVKMDANGEVPNCSVIGDGTARSLDSALATEESELIMSETPVVPMDSPVPTEDSLIEVEVICGVTGCPPEQWQTAYFDNPDLNGDPVLQRCEAAIDYHWGGGSPDPSIPDDYFSARWSRQYEVMDAGWYRFRGFTGDTINLYIDGAPYMTETTPSPFGEESETVELSEGTHEIKVEFSEYFGDAMIDFDWYRCANGLNDCNLPITAMYQTWDTYADIPLPEICTSSGYEAGQTIAGLGCTITSVSMALQAYGIDVTPDELNHWLSEPHPDTGVVPRGYRSACEGHLSWDEVLLFANKALFGDEHPDDGGFTWKFTDYSDDTENPEPESVIREQRQPVIMQVASGAHWILAVDVIERDGMLSLGIQDPHHAYACVAVLSSISPPASVIQCTPGPLKHAIDVYEEVAYRVSVVPDRYLALTDGQRPASLQIVASGTDFLLEDENGLRVGVDPQTGAMYQEMPNARYYNSAVTPYGYVNPEPGPSAHIVSDAQQEYVVVLSSSSRTGPQNSDSTASAFEVTGVGYDANYERASFTFSGSLLPGETRAYEITYLESNEFVITERSNGWWTYLPLLSRGSN